MPNVINYATNFSNQLRELYGQELTCDALYHSNSDIQISGAKEIKIPTLSVSGYKDHSRSSMTFNAGTYNNDYETKTLDHDRDIEFAIDPMDFDETDTVLSLANVQNRFERSQAIPELDCYTYSKLYSEAKRVGASVKTEALTTQNILQTLTVTSKFSRIRACRLTDLFCIVRLHTRNSLRMLRVFRERLILRAAAVLTDVFTALTISEQ